MTIRDYKVIHVQSAQKKEVIDYGVNMAGAPLEWGETMGEGVRVGIIDTGVDLRHEDLKDGIMDAISFVPNTRSAQDDNGHGTHVCGIIGARKNGVGVIGMAPACGLYVAKAFDKNGNGTFASIQKSIDWMIRKGVHMINMSFSSAVGNSGYEAILQKAYENGITLVCAAGNEGKQNDNSIGYPGKFPQTITVTAVDVYRKTAEFSSHGYESEICAAGQDVFSTYLHNSYAKLSGTSMATPIITGAAALFHGKGMRRYRRRLTPQETRFLLHMYTEDISNQGWDKYYGYGLFSFGRLEQSEVILQQRPPISHRGKR